MALVPHLSLKCRIIVTGGGTKQPPEVLYYYEETHTLKAIDRAHRVDIIKALRMRAQGYSYAKIGKMMNLSASSIQRAVGKIGDLLDNQDGKLSAYKEHETTILDAIRAKLINAIYDKLSDEKLAKKIDIQRLVWSFGVLLDKKRLIAGESTANIQQLTAIITAAHRDKSKTKDLQSNEAQPKKDKHSEPIEVEAETVPS